MRMSTVPIPKGRLNRALLLATTTSLLFLYLYLLVPSYSVDNRSLPDHRLSLPSLPLPSIYVHRKTDSEWCESKYSTAYLESLRDDRQSYCDPSISQSSFDCFSVGITASRKDSFCIANNVSFSHDHLSTPFKLDCTAGVPLDPNSFPKYMYDTGVNYLLSSYFSIDSRTVSSEVQQRAPFCLDSSKHPKFTILLKREGAGNLWHSLLEIFSLYLTIDVLRITPRGNSEANLQPFLSDNDIPSTQILLLDTHPDGPYFDLWKLFAPLPITRLAQLPALTTPACLQNVIIPLPEGSNPLWRGDWTSGNCTHSVLLDAFSERVVALHGIAPRFRGNPAKLTLTFIDRRSSRVLIGAAELLNKLKARFPDFHIQVIDFAAIPFTEQIRLIQGTDVLVGVHGAGLTHAMFLPAESSVVEILPHGLDYRVFRNLAKLKGHSYFSAHADDGGDIYSGKDWHNLDVRMEENRFFELVEAGLRAVLHKGTRSGDVI